MQTSTIHREQLRKFDEMLNNAFDNLGKEVVDHIEKVKSNFIGNKKTKKSKLVYTKTFMSIRNVEGCIWSNKDVNCKLQEILDKIYASKEIPLLAKKLVPVINVSKNKKYDAGKDIKNIPKDIEVNSTKEIKVIFYIVLEQLLKLGVFKEYNDAKIFCANLLITLKKLYGCANGKKGVNKKQYDHAKNQFNYFFEAVAENYVDICLKNKQQTYTEDFFNLNAHIDRVDGIVHFGKDVRAVLLGDKKPYNTQNNDLKQKENEKINAIKNIEDSIRTSVLILKDKFKHYNHERVNLDNKTVIHITKIGEVNAAIKHINIEKLKEDYKKALNEYKELSSVTKDNPYLDKSHSLLEEMEKIKTITVTEEQVVDKIFSGGLNDSDAYKSKLSDLFIKKMNINDNTPLSVDGIDKNYNDAFNSFKNDKKIKKITEEVNAGTAKTSKFILDEDDSNIVDSLNKIKENIAEDNNNKDIDFNSLIKEVKGYEKAKLEGPSNVIVDYLKKIHDENFNGLWNQIKNFFKCFYEEFKENKDKFEKLYQQVIKLNKENTFEIIKEEIINKDNIESVYYFNKDKGKLIKNELSGLRGRVNATSYNKVIEKVVDEIIINNNARSPENLKASGKLSFANSRKNSLLVAKNDELDSSKSVIGEKDFANNNQELDGGIESFLNTISEKVEDMINKNKDLFTIKRELKEMLMSDDFNNINLNGVKNADLNMTFGDNSTVLPASNSVTRNDSMVRSRSNSNSGVRNDSISSKKMYSHIKNITSIQHLLGAVLYSLTNFVNSSSSSDRANNLKKIKSHIRTDFKRIASNIKAENKNNSIKLIDNESISSDDDINDNVSVVSANTLISSSIYVPNTKENLEKLKINLLNDLIGKMNSHFSSISSISKTNKNEFLKLILFDLTCAKIKLSNTCKNIHKSESSFKKFFKKGMSEPLAGSTGELLKVLEEYVCKKIISFT